MAKIVIDVSDESGASEGDAVDLPRAGTTERESGGRGELAGGGGGRWLVAGYRSGDGVSSATGDVTGSGANGQIAGTPAPIHGPASIRRNLIRQWRRKASACHGPSQHSDATKE